MQHAPVRNPDTSRSFWSAFLIGVGIMAGVDEIIFHQLLAWHHFYDLSTPAVGLASDGVLHAAELIVIVAGFFLFADVRRRNALAKIWAWAGFFLGAGIFQVFDGLVNHKVLRIHQIRYDVYILPYDIAWNVFGGTLIVIGSLILLRARSAARPASRRAG